MLTAREPAPEMRVHNEEKENGSNEGYSQSRINSLESTQSIGAPK